MAGGLSTPVLRSVVVVPAAFVDFHGGGFAAVGAAEVAAEEDGESDAEAVAAEEAACVAVFGAVFLSEGGGEAERAAGPVGDDPLDDGDDDDDESNAAGDGGHGFVPMEDGPREGGDCGRDKQPLGEKQEGSDPEAIDDGLGRKTMHGLGQSTWHFRSAEISMLLVCRKSQLINAFMG